MPIDPGVESDSGGGAEANALFEGGSAELFGEFDGNADGPALDNFEAGAADKVLDGFLGVQFGIPGIPEWGAVVEDLEEVCQSSRDDEFEGFVVLAGDACDVAVLVESDDPVFIFEFTVAHFEPVEMGGGLGAEFGEGDNVTGGGGYGEDCFEFSELFDSLDGDDFVGADKALDIGVGVGSRFALGLDMSLVEEGDGVGEPGCFEDFGVVLDSLGDGRLGDLDRFGVVPVSFFVHFADG